MTETSAEKIIRLDLDFTEVVVLTDPTEVMLFRGKKSLFEKIQQIGIYSSFKLNLNPLQLVFVSFGFVKALRCAKNSYCL